METNGHLPRMNMCVSKATRLFPFPRIKCKNIIVVLLFRLQVLSGRFSKWHAYN